MPWTWDTDNSSFNISWADLRLTSSADFETQSTYLVRINVNDWLNNYAERFTITINNLWLTDITLTSTDVDENVSWSTLVWNLWNVDLDTWNTYTYNLTSWTWDTDNWSFTVTWTWLTINSVPDFETKSSYAIRLNVNDWSNNFEKQFTITINNLNESPTDLTLSWSTIDENVSWWTTVWTLWNVDEDTWNTYTYSLLHEHEIQIIQVLLFHEQIWI